jgi:peptidoglycan/LPS O-acetylase OafA/YrhL
MDAAVPQVSSAGGVEASSSARPRAGFGNFDTMDCARGLLALLIVYEHTEAPLRIFRVAPAAYLAVDMFFAASGFVLAHAYDARFAAGLTARQFILLRWIRLLPYLIIAAVVALAAHLIHVVTGSEPLALRPFVQAVALCFLIPVASADDTTLFPINLPAWSLHFELLTNAVFALCWRVSSRQLLLFIVACAPVLAYFIMSAGTADIGSEWSDYVWTLPRALFGFSVGVYLRRTWDGQSREWPWLAHALTPLVVLLLAVRPPEAWAAALDAVLALVVLPVLLAVMVRVEAGPVARKWYRRFGATSYGVYAIHYPLGSALGDVVPYLRVDVLRPYVYLALFIALLCLVEWLNPNVDTPLRRAISRRLGLSSSSKSVRPLPLVSEQAVR